MSFNFGLGRGHLGPASLIRAIEREHDATYVRYHDPQCTCGWGCRTSDCPASERHWWAAANLGSPFDYQRARAVKAALLAGGATVRYRGKRYPYEEERHDPR
jgi:hypothetical protein